MHIHVSGINIEFDSVAIKNPIFFEGLSTFNLLFLLLFWVNKKNTKLDGMNYRYSDLGESEQYSSWIRQLNRCAYIRKYLLNWNHSFGCPSKYIMAMFIILDNETVISRLQLDNFEMKFSHIEFDILIIDNI